MFNLKILGLFILFAAAAFSSCSHKEKWVTPRFDTLGTSASITVIADSALAERTVHQAREEITRLGKIFNRYSQESEISGINRSLQDQIAVSPEVLKVLRRAKTICLQSGGVFDISLLPLIEIWDYKKGKIPSENQIQEALSHSGCETLQIFSSEVLKKTGTKLDTGGIAKGFIIDEAAAALKKAGITEGIVEIGGDLFAFGKIWRVGILNPKTKTPAYALSVKDQAVVTSGDYERFFEKNGVIYSHILDPRTGKPAQVLSHSVTVIGPEAMTADGLATAFFILGPEKSFEILKKYPQYAALFILPDGKTLVSPGFSYEIENLSE